MGEFVAAHLPAYEFAREVVNRFVTPPSRGNADTFITAMDKPREIAAKDMIPSLAEQGDLTSAMIRFRQMADESERGSRPARPGRRVHV